MCLRVALVVRLLRIEQGVSANDIANPVQTEPGHTAQVDFG